MQVTCLEMEKARRRAERMSAAQRIHDIDARLGQIESEKQFLLHAIGQPVPKPPSRLPGLEIKPTPQPRGAGFRIRY